MSKNTILSRGMSIGVDIELISRFKGLSRKSNGRFLNRVFTKKELDYCFSKKIPAQHLAARFAAKEAVVKAISPLGEKPPVLNKIGVVNDAMGIPSISLKDYSVVLSLSHCKDSAVAFVVLERK